MKEWAWPTPLGVVLLIVATSTALPMARWGDSPLVLILVPAGVAAYLVGRRMAALAPAVVAFSMVFAFSLPMSFVVPGSAPLGDWMTSVAIALLTIVSPWWFGRYRLLRAEQRTADVTLMADRAQAEERARIADDLHDTIGHELALIAVQAGALELERDLSPRQLERFRELREAAVRASGRLRDVVEMTRPDDGPGRLDPIGADGLDALVMGAREAGITINADVDRSTLSMAHPLVAELVVRTVREGLTNSARHAPGSAVSISVMPGEPDEVIVRVRSTRLTRTESPGGGHGIPSLRRRAELLGATIDAGPDDTGFELRLRASLQPRRPDTGVTDLGVRTNAHSARRRLLQTAAFPAAIIALALVGFIVVQAITVTQTAISSDVYDEIHLGATRDELATVLPGGTPRPVPVVTEPPAPDGAQCEYFAARDGWLHFTDATYRLCFIHGVLVEKMLLGAT
ncbi:hypothetical protein D7252_03815 [Microbacterium sp. CGR2]|nr:hypothetical protein D7252_03815 [Microbacterium sp. CGR2]